MEYEIELPQDEDGFTTFQCPYCKEQFKLRNDEFMNSERNHIYCPICGLTNAISTFYTKDVYEKVEEIAEKAIYEMLNEAFGGMKSNEYFKVDFDEFSCDQNKILSDKNYSLKVADIGCCEVHVKVRGIDKFIGVYCPYCGRDNIE